MGTAELQGVAARWSYLLLVAFPVYPLTIYVFVLLCFFDATTGSS